MFDVTVKEHLQLPIHLGATAAGSVRTGECS